jgi:hypothetical protein
MGIQRIAELRDCSGVCPLPAVASLREPALYFFLHPTDGSPRDLDAARELPVLVQLIDGRFLQANQFQHLLDAQKPNRSRRQIRCTRSALIGEPIRSRNT